MTDNKNETALSVFEIKHIFTGNVVFSAKIDCDINASYSLKLGMAVKLAIESRAGLSNANLSGADLSGANLSDANLCRADLSGADLSGADLYRADLSGANLSDADLSGANLSDANLYHATLYRTDLSGADMSGADLYRADLSGANLSGANLCRAKQVPNVFSFGYIGKEKITGFAYEKDGKCFIKLGCFDDTSEKAIEAVIEEYGLYSEYVDAVKCAETVILKRMKK